MPYDELLTKYSVFNDSYILSLEIKYLSFSIDSKVDIYTIFSCYNSETSKYKEVRINFRVVSDFSTRMQTLRRFSDVLIAKENNEFLFDFDPKYLLRDLEPNPNSECQIKCESYEILEQLKL